MIAPGSGLAVLIASLILAAHPLRDTSPPSTRAPHLSVVPVRLDAEALRVWRRAIAADDARTLAMLHARHPTDGTLLATHAANGKSALMVACKVGDLALARALVAAGADPRETTVTGGTPFMFAVLGDRLDVARWLRGLDVPLDAAGSNGWSSVTLAAATGLDDMLEWLLAAGAAPDPADVYGYTPLMRAADNGHADAARRLLDAGVRVDAVDERGNTALHHAVANGDAAVVELLLERGADAALADRDGITPAALAAAAAVADDEAGRGSTRALPAGLVARLEGGAGAGAGEGRVR